MTIYRLYHTYGPDGTEGQSDYAHKEGAIKAMRFWSSMHDNYHWYIKRITK